MTSTIECEVKDVIIKPEKMQPIIVNFQNGELKDEEASKMQCALLEDKEKGEKFIALSNGQVVYKGVKPDVNQQMSYTIIALRNKKTGKVKMYQAERWQVNAILDTGLHESNEATTVEKLATLNKQFGSKKVKRRTEQFEKNRINIETMEEQLQNSISNVQLDKEEDMNSENNIMDNFALKMNRDAIDVTDIYDLDDIVPKNTLTLLYETANKVAEDESAAGEVSDFFKKSMDSLRQRNRLTAKNLAILIYIESVSEWIRMPLKLVKKNISVCPFSEEVSKHILDNYSVSTSNGRQRPMMIKDKAMLHCIILSLIALEFTLDLELFTSVFKVGIKKFLTLARVAGAVPLKNNKSVVVLKLPLPPPIEIAPKAKRKNK